MKNHALQFRRISEWGVYGDNLSRLFRSFVPLVAALERNDCPEEKRVEPFPDPFNK